MNLSTNCRNCGSTIFININKCNIGRIYLAECPKCNRQYYVELILDLKERGDL